MADPISRAAFADALSDLPPEALRALLEVTEYGASEAKTSAELAQRCATLLWWSWSTPIGFVTTKATLGDIVDDVATKLELSALLDDRADAWEKLERLRAEVLDAVEPAALDAMDADIQSRLNGPSWVPSFFGASTAGSAWSAGRVGAWVVRLGAGPIGRLLPLIPQLAPYWKAIRGVALIASAVGTPLAIGAGVLSVNHALGSNYRRMVPLLLGAGALLAARSEEPRSEE